MMIPKEDDFMNDPAGTVYRIAELNPPVHGCTVSSMICRLQEESITHFALAAGTGISAEHYTHPSMYIGALGCVKAGLHMKQQIRTAAFGPGELLLVPAGTDTSFQAEQDSVYTELNLAKEAVMNKAIEAGTIYRLRDLIPVQKGKIINLDLMESEHMKFVVMALGDGCELPEHAAPGEAVLFVLEGKAALRYEGRDHVLSAGDNFSFAKGGLHSVKAIGPLKIALLLALV